MSRIFSKRSGFTLVEIVVAFAVFAIMAAMLVSLTGLAVRQRQSNTDLSRRLSDQQAYLASHERETDITKTDTSGGNKFEFNFDGVSPASLNYGVAYATADGTNDGISYFVSEAKSNPGNIIGDGDKDDPDGGTGLALAEKVDSRIYGSKDFEYIQISDVNEVPDPDVIAAGNSMFTLDVYAVDSDAAVNKKDSRYARNYKLRFESDIVDCGYVDSSGNRISYKDAHFGSDGKVIGGGTNQFELVKCSDDTMRVSIPQIIIKDNFADEEPDDQYCFPGVRSHFYVVLKGDVNLTAASFGDNYTINAYGEYLYKPVTAMITTTTKKEDGTEETTTERVNLINVYGAKPKAGTVILDPEEEGDT